MYLLQSCLWDEPTSLPGFSPGPQPAVLTHLQVSPEGILSIKRLISNFHLSCISAAAAAKSRQSCLTLCDPIDGSPPGSPVPGILQARTLEWVAIAFSNAWKWKVKVKSLSRVWLLAAPWTAAYQAPPSMGFSRQEYWSGVPSPSPSCISSGSNLRYRMYVLSRSVMSNSLWPRGLQPSSSSVHGIF